MTPKQQELEDSDDAALLAAINAIRRKYSRRAITLEEAIAGIKAAVENSDEIRAQLND